MIAFISFIAVLSILVIVHEFGHFIVAKKMGVRVEKFSIGFGPEIFGITRNETRYAVSLVPLGGYVKLSGETSAEEIKGEKWEYLSRSVGERARIIFAGPVLNYMLAFFIFAFVFMVGNPTMTSKVGKLIPGYPAERSGIKPGDKIVKINNKAVEYWEDVTKIIYSNKAPEIELVIERNNVLIHTRVGTQAQEFKTMFGSKKKASIIGIAPSDEIVYVRYGIIQSFYMAGEKLLTLSYITYRALWASLIGTIPFKESITGPVGIFYITGQAAKLGIMYLLQLMAVLSASLAIFNVLPVPVLDGGHLLFLGIEKVCRKPLSHRVQENITQVGLYLLIFLMVFVFYNDFMRFGIFEKIAQLWHR